MNNLDFWITPIGMMSIGFVFTIYLLVQIRTRIHWVQMQVHEDIKRFGDEFRYIHKDLIDVACVLRRVEGSIDRCEDVVNHIPLNYKPLTKEDVPYATKEEIPYAEEVKGFVPKLHPGKYLATVTDEKVTMTRVV